MSDGELARRLVSLHQQFRPRQRVVAERRRSTIAHAELGVLPDHSPPSETTTGTWRVEIPAWCRDQRNLMSTPADDARLVVKALNSGAPAVLLDLEDSLANFWPRLRLGIDNIRAALHGELTYSDAATGRAVRIERDTGVTYVRVRGLHIGQGGIIPGEAMSASLYDLASIFYRLDLERLAHPLCVMNFKSEFADEALSWRDVFVALTDSRQLPRNYIKCMVIAESHPLAYALEEFAYNLRDHIVGLTLGRLDYMASLIHCNFEDPRWVLPDRNDIPHDAPFYQRLRDLIVDISHKRGLLAIGGMTALFPARDDPARNARALAVLEADKRNEATCLMDGAWTGHPDQNEIALRQFPAPNQRFVRKPSVERYPELRIPVAGARTLSGSRAAAASIVAYRHALLHGHGVSLIDGFMEDMATERIYRLTLAQRVRHCETVPILDGTGVAVHHGLRALQALFDGALETIHAALPVHTPPAVYERYREARHAGEALIVGHAHDPI